MRKVFDACRIRISTDDNVAVRRKSHDYSQKKLCCRATPVLVTLGVTKLLRDQY